jgi:nucleotide-binding universal stress UspA family protein
METFSMCGVDPMRRMLRKAFMISAETCLAFHPASKAESAHADKRRMVMLNILIPIDGSRSAMQAVEYAIRGKAREQLQIHLTHVQPRFTKYLTRFVSAQSVRLLQKERADAAMAGAIGLLDEANVPYTVHVDKGNVASAIVARARQVGAQRIVMGTTRKNALTRFFQRSVVDKVMASSDLPVEIIAKERATKLERFAAPVGLGLAFLWLAVE